jgi:hypothetical protein
VLGWKREDAVKSQLPVMEVLTQTKASKPPPEKPARVLKVELLQECTPKVGDIAIVSPWNGGSG